MFQDQYQPRFKSQNATPKMKSTKIISTDNKKLPNINIVKTN